MNFINKFNVFFNEYNLLMGSGGVAYLPLVSGILSANAKKIQELRKILNFINLFSIQTQQKIL